MFCSPITDFLNFLEKEPVQDLKVIKKDKKVPALYRADIKKKTTLQGPAIPALTVRASWLYYD